MSDARSGTPMNWQKSSPSRLQSIALFLVVLRCDDDVCHMSCTTVDFIESVTCSVIGKSRFFIDSQTCFHLVDLCLTLSHSRAVKALQILFRQGPTRTWSTDHTEFADGPIIPVEVALYHYQLPPARHDDVKEYFQDWDYLRQSLGFEQVDDSCCWLFGSHFHRCSICIFLLICNG